MDFAMWEVEFFQLASGRCPVAQFLSTLNETTDLPYIDHIFSLAEGYGYALSRPHSAPLRDKIFELRVSTENGQFRFLYSFDHKKIIITHGLKKKTRKVPNREIEKAINYREMYFESGEK
jgi:phage-related protein